MPTPKQITDQIDQRFGVHFAKLMQGQANYKAQNGRYAQGLRTHSILPADGNARAADRLDDHPHYQPESWNDLAQKYGFTFPPDPRAAIEVHQYVQPNGTCGWVVFLTAEIAGRIWQRSINGAGDETWRTTGWADVTPGTTMRVAMAGPVVVNPFHWERLLLVGAIEAIVIIASKMMGWW